MKKPLLFTFPSVSEDINLLLNSNMNRKFVVPKNDLEAYTIIGLLDRNNEDVLAVEINTWGVCWEDIFNLHPELDTYEGQLIGVEIIDYNQKGEYFRPKNSVSIDHHKYGNIDKSNTYSSIEQIALLLNVPLTLEERLVAENDKDYIPAMLELLDKVKGEYSISDEEIVSLYKYIRNQELLIQGITKEQIEEAIDSIENNSETVGDLIIVNCNHSKTAPICDELFPKSEILIVTDSDYKELNYFTRNHIPRLKEALNSNFESIDNCWFGESYICTTNSELINFIIEEVKTYYSDELSNEAM